MTVTEKESAQLISEQPENTVANGTTDATTQDVSSTAKPIVQSNDDTSSSVQPKGDSASTPSTKDSALPTPKENEKQNNVGILSDSNTEQASSYPDNMPIVIIPDGTSQKENICHAIQDAGFHIDNERHVILSNENRQTLFQQPDLSVQTSGSATVLILKETNAQHVWKQLSTTSSHQSLFASSLVHTSPRQAVLQLLLDNDARQHITPVLLLQAAQSEKKEGPAAVETATQLGVQPPNEEAKALKDEKALNKDTTVHVPRTVLVTDKPVVSPEPEGRDLLSEPTSHNNSNNHVLPNKAQGNPPANQPKKLQKMWPPPTANQETPSVKPKDKVTKSVGTHDAKAPSVRPPLQNNSSKETGNEEKTVLVEAQHVASEAPVTAISEATGTGAKNERALPSNSEEQDATEKQDLKESNQDAQTTAKSDALLTSSTPITLEPSTEHKSQETKELNSVGATAHKQQASSPVVQKVDKRQQVKVAQTTKAPATKPTAKTSNRTTITTAKNGTRQLGKENVKVPAKKPVVVDHGDGQKATANSSKHKNSTHTLPDKEKPSHQNSKPTESKPATNHRIKTDLSRKVPGAEAPKRKVVQTTSVAREPKEKVETKRISRTSFLARMTAPTESSARKQVGAVSVSTPLTKHANQPESYTATFTVKTARSRIVKMGTATSPPPPPRDGKKAKIQSDLVSTAEQAPQQPQPQNTQHREHEKSIKQ